LICSRFRALADRCWRQRGHHRHGSAQQAPPHQRTISSEHQEIAMNDIVPPAMRPISQHSMRFWGQLAYHDYEGLALELDEQRRLVAALGSQARLLAPRMSEDLGQAIVLDNRPGAGDGPAMADLMGGHIQAAFAAGASAVPQVRAGKLRALGVTNRSGRPRRLTCRR